MEIADWRREIDWLDEQLVELFSERARAAQAIGALKRTSERPIFEPDREQQVIEHVCRVNPGPIPNEHLSALFTRVMELMRTMQTIQNTSPEPGNNQETQ